jgi:hypothetical protein
MATLIVEDGSIVSGANTYVTVAEFTQFCSDRNITITSTYGDESELLIQAMDYFEQQPFKGIKFIETQPLQFPRSDFYLDGYLTDSDAIPQLVKDAQITIAVSIMQGNDPLTTLDRSVKREQVDVLEIEYMDNAGPSVIIRSISNIMRKLVVSSTMGSSFRTIRV